MFAVAVNTRRAVVGTKELITTGSAGIQVQFGFSEDWDDLSKFAVFRNGEDPDTGVTVALDANNKVALPAQNCAAEYVDEAVFCGVYGTDGLGTVIIPTIWVSIGVLREGVSYEGVTPAEPTPDMWAQMLAIANSVGQDAEAAAEAAQAAAESARDGAVTAKNTSEAQALKSEGYAVGKQGGQDVGTSSTYWHNNAKYYKEQAADSANNAANSEANASGSATAASGSASSAGTNALKAEGHAVGQQNGTDVDSGSSYYHNNAKYYKEQAASSATTASTKAGEASGSATTASNKAGEASASALAASGSASSASTNALKAEGYAIGKQNGEDVSSGSDYYHANAKYYSEQAGTSATNAGTSETNASGSASSASTNALKAEGFAVGEQGGEAVASGSPYYHNNAAYYAGVAEAVLESIPEDYSELSDDVDSLKSALNASTGIAQIPLYAANRYIDLSGTSVVMVDGVPQLTTGTTTYSVSMMQCSAGDVFTINGVGGSTPRLWGFVSSTGAILTRSAAGASATNAIITAPTNAAWIITHTNNGAKSYFGKLLPIKITEIDTAISNIDTVDEYIQWEQGNIGANDGYNYSASNRCRTANVIKYSGDQVITLKPNVRFAMRYYGNDGSFVKGSPDWHTVGGTIGEILEKDSKNTTNLSGYRIVLSYQNDATISFPIVMGENLTITAKGNLNDVYSAIRGNTSGIDVNLTGRGNCSIRCAKEHSYIDGSHPVIEWYLLEEPNTGRFYYSKDLAEKKYLFTFPYDAYKYSFGVLQNGDVIAVLDADSITTDNKDDANRVNPYVFLASENWAICHEVDFGSSLKPCGWLGNSGFKVIANGDALFCEYTRQTTYTCNVWKLSGDPLNASNWVATKSFVVTSTDNATLFKHAHMVMQDFYTGVCYMSTGDDLIGAMMWASTDNGATWTQLVSPDSDGQVNQYGYINGSEKYCRCLTMTFTKDYIYWATDSSSAVLHWLFKAGRDENGVLDYSTVVDYVNIPENNGASTYGTAYVPELNAIVLLDRCDVIATEMNVKMVTLADGQLHTIGKMESASGSRNIGFRTRFSEWYPKNGLIHFGFALHIGRLTNAVNQNNGFNNSGSGDNPLLNINNLAMQVYKNGNDFGMVMHTDFI